MRLLNAAYCVERTTCPLCYASIDPIFLAGQKFKSDSTLLHEDHYAAVFKCGHCKNSFMVQYSGYEQASIGSYPKYLTEDYCGPVHYNKRKFEDVIEDLSPLFTKTYNQAHAAEVHELDQIAGAGYRRAVEFLIKDFLIYQSPDDEEEIKAEFLGNCIKKRVDNSQLKEIAKRAAWLGNDHSHYEQRFDDKDINDLKLLIELSMHWVSLILLTKKAIQDLPES